MADIFDFANDVVDKGREVASDLIDAASDLAGKGIDFAGDLANNAGDYAAKGKIKAQLLDQKIEFDGLMLELGRAVYDKVKDDPEFVEANEALFAKIAVSVQRKQDLEDELSAIDAAAAAAKPIDVEPLKDESAAVAEEAAAVAEQIKEEA